MTKKEELMTMIGKETSDNYSPTFRSKLIAIYDTYCLWEIAPNQWNDEGNEAGRHAGDGQPAATPEPVRSAAGAAGHA